MHKLATKITTFKLLHNAKLYIVERASTQRRYKMIQFTIRQTGDCLESLLGGQKEFRVADVVEVSLPYIADGMPALQRTGNGTVLALKLMRHDEATRYVSKASTGRWVCYEVIGRELLNGI